MKTKINIALMPICVLFLSACTGQKVIEWNGKMEYYHLTIIYDKTNMYETVWQVDYIFI